MWCVSLSRHAANTPVGCSSAGWSWAGIAGAVVGFAVGSGPSVRRRYHGAGRPGVRVGGAPPSPPPRGARPLHAARGGPRAPGGVPASSPLRGVGGRRSGPGLCVVAVSLEWAFSSFSRGFLGLLDIASLTKKAPHQELFWARTQLSSRLTSVLV